MIRRLFAAAALAAMFLAPIGARADALPGSYHVCKLTTSSPTVCGLVTDTQLVGFYNNSLSAQTVTISCTYANGDVYLVGALGITQIFTEQTPGRPIVGQATCTLSGSPVGGWIEYRSR